MGENTNLAWEDQKKTYASFLKLTKWSIIAMVVLVVFLYIVINP